MKNLLIIPLLFACNISMGQNVDSASIIGRYRIIGNLVVAQYSFPYEMTWNDAKAACTRLGNGWRLPTKNELNILYQYRGKIGGFKAKNHWSSAVYPVYFAGYQSFGNGVQDAAGMNSASYVRAVRTSQEEIKKIAQESGYL